MASPEPFSEHPDNPKEAHDKAARQLVLSYKRVFAGEHGERVLADLKKRFGFDRWDAADTEDAAKIVRRVFMKGPLYHIEQMRTFVFRRQNKPKQIESP